MVQIKHFFAFILAAATVIAPVAAKKKPNIVKGIGRLNLGGNLYQVTVQVQVDKKGPTPVNYTIDTENDGGLLFSGKVDNVNAFHHHSVEKFSTKVLNKTETTLEAETEHSSRLGPEGTILNLQLEKMEDSVIPSPQAPVQARDYSEMFARFFGNT